MNDKITITVDGVERELFMSFGMLNALTKIVGDPGQISAVSVVPELREQVLKTLLADRMKSGKVSIPVEDLDNLDISLDDVEAILGWMQEHVMGFFVRSLRKIAAMTATHGKEIKDLESSMAGSSA